MHKLRYIILLVMGTMQATHKASLTLLESTPPHYTWQITLPLDKGDIFYTDYFDVATDNPGIKIDSWKIDQNPHEAYDATFKQTKKIIDKPVTLSIVTTIQEISAQAQFHINYYRRSHNTISHEMLAVPYTPPPAPLAQLEEEEKHYSLLKKQEMFYTPPPIPLAIFLVLTLLMASYYLRQRRDMRGIILISFSVFLCFQLAKSLVINWKKPYNWGHTALSERKPPRFTKSILNGGTE